MTFQVGIVGSDGVLLASDFKHSDGMRNTSTSSKLAIRKGIAYCAAGDNAAAILAREYAEDFQGGDVGSELFAARKRAMEQSILPKTRPRTRR